MYGAGDRISFGTPAFPIGTMGCLAAPLIPVYTDVYPGASDDDSCSWVPATHAGDLD